MTQGIIYKHLKQSTNHIIGLSVMWFDGRERQGWNCGRWTFSIVLCAYEWL